MVIAYWILGNVLQAAFAWLTTTAFAWLTTTAGLLDPETASRAGLVLGWGLLFVISFIFRERLDDWLRS